MEGLDGLDDVDVALRFEGADRESVVLLKQVFAEDDYLEQHAFSGVEVFTVVAKLTASTIGKLLDFFARKGATTPKPIMEIGARKISISGMSRADMEALLASPGFKAAVKAVKAK